jgi:hypothetical protein
MRWWAAILVVHGVLGSGLAAGADLVQPWSRGFSNLEVHLTANQERRWTLSTVLGGSPMENLSLGVFASLGEEDDLGGLAILSLPLDEEVNLDLWLEVGGFVLPREAEQRQAWYGGGAEISWPYRGLTPYARLTAYRQADGWAVHPLLGLLVPAGERWRFHCEVSGEKTPGNPWPLHLTLGPNVALGPSATLITEVSYLWDRTSARKSWAGSVGLVLDPSTLLVGRSTGRF